jgi:hypothetical protein
MPKEKPDIELPLPASAGVRPVAGETHATAAQLAAALGLPGLDDAFLRNHHKDGIPKPVKGKYPINETIIALLKFYHAKSGAAGELPASYDSAQAMANAFGAEKKSVLWLTRNGAESAQLGGSRIAPVPVIRRALEIIGQIAAGNVTGIDGMEQWNHQTELAKKLRLESEKLADEQKLRRGQMLLNRDGTAALEDFVVEDVLNDLRERPLRAALVNLDKTINRQHKNIIQDEAKSRQCATVTTASIQTMLEKIRQKLPAPKTVEEKSE